MKNRLAACAWLLVPAALLASGCADVQAKAAFKDGNKAYLEENFKQAIPEYERAISLDPDMAEAHFYLGSSHQALYRPGRETAENKEHLDQAIEHYKKALEVGDPNRAAVRKVRANALGALVGIYSEPPYRDYDTALGYAQQLVKDNPDDARNLYAIANLYEKFGKIDQAEQSYRRISELNPSDPKACGALAAFYNKPLWEGRSKFDQAIEILQRCADLAPSDPSGYQKVATFYWDKAYRDPLLSDEQKRDYADKGLAAVEKALELKPDYFEAIIYKGLLYRVKAGVATNPRERMQFLEMATNLQKQGLELKKQQEAEAAAAQAAGSPAPGSGS